MNKLVIIIKALMKPRPLLGMLVLAIPIAIGTVLNVSVWWSIPAAFFWADMFNVVWKFFAEKSNA